MELTDEELDLLLDDWFERDGETFINVTNVGRLGWEKTLSEGESYSSYLIEAPTTKDLIKRAYPLANDTIVAMEPPTKVTVKISKSSTSYTDGKVLCVSTEVFDEPELSNGEKLDVFLGLTVHEGCHLLWTENNKKEPLLEKGRNFKILHHIWNTLEDERIESICGLKKPGFARFLEKSKYYYFDMLFIDEMGEEEELNDFEIIMSAFFRIIRYPKYLSKEDFRKFGDYLIRIKEILVPYPKDTAETVEAAKYIYDILKEFYKEVKESKLPPLGEGKGEGSGEGSSTESMDVGDKGEDDGEEGEDKDETKERRTLSEEEVEELIEREGAKISKVMEKMFGDAESGKGAKLSSVLTSLDASIIEGTLIEGSEGETFFEKAEDNRTIYMRSYEKISKFIPSIRKMIVGHCKEYKLIHKSMRSGTFDTTKLAEAYQGVPTVYMREGAVKTDKVAIVVLIDESGSMSYSKINSARDAAVLLNESFANIPNVELYIYGHSGDNITAHSTDLIIYREKGFTPKYALGSVASRRENRDGTAILTVAKRVRKQTKEHCLYFILSDGAPSASAYRGESAIRDVRDKVSKVEKMGFSVIQVCIEHSYDPAKMFKHFVILNDMSTLAYNLGKLIKKVTIQNAKERVI